MEQPPLQARPDAAPEGDPSRPKHDPGLRHLFSHQRMVTDLLRLLPGDLTEGFDLGALHSRRNDMPCASTSCRPPARPMGPVEGAGRDLGPMISP